VSQLVSQQVNKKPMNKKFTLILILLIVAFAAAGLAYWKLSQGKVTTYPAGQGPLANSNQNVNTNAPVDEPVEIDPETGWKIYRNKEYGFEFKYPENIDGIKFYFFRSNEPYGSLPDGIEYFILRPEIFQEEIFSVTITRQSSDALFNDFWAKRPYLSKNFSDVESINVVIDGKKGILIKYSLEGLKNYYYIIEGKEYNYIIQGWSNNNTVNSDSLLQNIFNSLKLT